MHRDFPVDFIFMKFCKERAMTIKTLLITRDSSLSETFCKVVDAVKGCQLTVFANLDESLPHIDHPDSAVVVLHLAENAIAAEDELGRLLQQITARRLAVAVLVVLDAHRPDQILATLRMGVADCLVRPIDLRRAAFLIDSLTLRARHQPRASAARPLPPSVQRIGQKEPYLYCSGPMARVVNRVRKVAGLDSNILLTGETGTGKSRTARLVHELSLRSAEPFLTVNCAALPETLLESELFGHCRGAFTGADSNQLGRFAQAGSGTLFLDEIDALPLASQAKLLRAVDERVFEQVGSSKPQRFQARLIVATNQSLEAEVKAGRFRADLYYRLNVVEIPIPALRQRRSEIRYIVEQQIEETASRNNRPPARLGPGVLDLLEAYQWPGNIRELRNVVERALAFCEQNEISIADLPDHLRPVQASQPAAGEAKLPANPLQTNVKAFTGAAFDPKSTHDPDEPDSGVFSFAPNLSSLAKARLRGEVDRIRQALRRHNNNRTEAARELGISRTALYKKLSQYEMLDDPQLG
jgi:DNA-binding NtrC family response regulator